MDTSDIGTVAAKLMETLADEEGDEAQVGIVAVVVEVSKPITEAEFIEEYGEEPEDLDELRETRIQFRCSDGRGWVQRGLFTEAAERA